MKVKLNFYSDTFKEGIMNVPGCSLMWPELLRRKYILSRLGAKEAVNARFKQSDEIVIITCKIIRRTGKETTCH